MKSAVSPAIPKVPSSKLAATSSEVWPIIAISVSWMAVAPFMATEVRMPRSIRSMSTGARPHLITCPPMPIATVRWAEADSTTCPTNSVKSFPTVPFGSEARKSSKDASGFGARAKSSTRTLFVRRAMGIVRMLLKSIGVGIGIGVLQPVKRLPEKLLAFVSF